jgi:hypothetical protein
MNYETPEITALTPAVKAIQGQPKWVDDKIDAPSFKEPTPAYQDWEE